MKNTNPLIRMAGSFLYLVKCESWCSYFDGKITRDVRYWPATIKSGWITT